MRDEKTRNYCVPNDGSKTRSCNPLTMSQLTEYYKRKQRLNDERQDNKKDFPRREIKRPYLLKLPKIVQQQERIMAVTPEKESDTGKNQQNTSGFILPIIKSENGKKASTRTEYQLKDSSQLGIGVNKDFSCSAECSPGFQRETSKRNDQETDQNKADSKGKEQTSDKWNEVEKKIESIDNLKVPVAAMESITCPNNSPKRISCNEYAKKMMLRKKKSWKDRRKEAKLFDINLLNSQRAMLTSSATARGLKVLKANEVIIYRFCLSNYSDVDNHTVAE